MTIKPAEVSRPVILYVEKVDTQPQLQEYLETRRLSVIDIQIDAVQAVQIIEFLRERNNQGIPGAILLRFTGRLIHL